MGEKTVVHIFAEEFVEINRCFVGCTVRIRKGESLFMYCVLQLLSCLIFVFPFFIFSPQEFLSFEFSVGFH
jgi:hypothetical protein